MDKYSALHIKPLITPDHPARRALLDAYRAGLAEGPAVAWTRAMAMRDRFPHQGDDYSSRILLLTLGLFSIEDREALKQGRYPNPIGDHRVWTGTRLARAASVFGLSTDELASRVLEAWVSAACDMDGEPAPDLPIPPSFSVVGEGAGADHRCST
jgi:hypothetical protein